MFLDPSHCDSIFVALDVDVIAPVVPGQEKHLIRHHRIRIFEYKALSPLVCVKGCWPKHLTMKTRSIMIGAKPVKLSGNRTVRMQSHPLTVVREINAGRQRDEAQVDLILVVLLKAKEAA